MRTSVGGLEVRSGVDAANGESFLRVGWHRHAPAGTTDAPDVIRPRLEAPKHEPRRPRSAPANRREFEQEMADLPARDRRRLLLMAAMERDGWACLVIAPRVLFVLSLAVPLALACILFIASGTEGQWGMFVADVVPPASRAALVFGALMFAAREATLRLARPGAEHFRRAWEKAFDRFA